MMRAIYKYPIPIEVTFTLSLPRGAEILSFTLQRDRRSRSSRYAQPCLWAMVDVGRPCEPVRFRVFGTGHPIEDDLAGRVAHVGTVQDGSFVWHLFRELEGRA